MDIIEYPKINTIWKRVDVNGRKGPIIPGNYSDPIFSVFPKWHITEKVDGTNIRVIYDPATSLKPQFRGKTDNAQLHAGLWTHLQDNITPEKLAAAFPRREIKDDPRIHEWPEVILFGEGYGAKINSGELYRSDQGVILYDIFIDGYWLEYENVVKIAEKLGLPVVPSFGVISTEHAIELVDLGHQSMLKPDGNKFEGIVATSYPMVLDRKTKNPVKWKLKIKDYNAIRKFDPLSKDGK